MLLSYKRSQTSVVLRVKLLSSAVTTGAGLTGLTSASAGLIISTIADNEATATAYTVTGGTIETIATLGTYAAPTATKCRFKEVDATNHPGVYEIQIADARFAVASAKSMIVSLSGAANLAQTDCLIPLVDLDPYAEASTFDPASDTVDGVTYQRAMKAIMAVLLGKATVSGNNIVFKARDGSTTDVTVTVSSTVDGDRSASTLA